MDGFTLLPFAFCAMLVSHHGQDLLELGDVVVDKCETFALIGDSGDDFATIEGHAFAVFMFEGGAEVTIDGKKYIVSRTTGA